MMSVSEEMARLDDLFGPDALTIHRVRRCLFEKRLVVVHGSKFVLYKFFSPWRTKKLATLLNQAQGMDIRVQRPLDAVLGLGEALHHGGFWLVTAYEHGETRDAKRLNADYAASLGRTLGRLHSIQSPTFGPLFAWRAPWKTLRRHVEAECGDVVATLGRDDPTEKTRLTAWMRSAAVVFDNRRLFNLVHGDVLQKNIILGRDVMEACLIDYELAAFELAGLELASVRTRFFHGESAKYAPAFTAAYFANCDKTITADWERFGCHYLVYANLRFAHRLLRRARVLERRGLTAESANRLGRARKFWRQAVALATAHAQGQSNPEALLTFVIHTSGICRV
ncbi:MAG: aminoglycoside phosphotransferase family protein [Spartobacteria bacterium]|nr:aminoglycoside phosphotransferase family protein [Spartobacteria bacterium]